MLDLTRFARIAAADHGLCVVTTGRADGTFQSSVVNAGVMADGESPVRGGGPVVAFVAGGAARKLANLRVRPAVTVTARSGWQWACVEGKAVLCGPDDPMGAVDAEGLRVLLRAVFTAAGGTHDDWDTYDRVMAEERRVAVFVRPLRAYGVG